MQRSGGTPPVSNSAINLDAMSAAIQAISERGSTPEPRYVSSATYQSMLREYISEDALRQELMRPMEQTLVGGLQSVEWRTPDEATDNFRRQQEAYNRQVKKAPIPEDLFKAQKRQDDNDRKEIERRLRAQGA